MQPVRPRPHRTIHPNFTANNRPAPQILHRKTYPAPDIPLALRLRAPRLRLRPNIPPIAPQPTSRPDKANRPVLLAIFQKAVCARSFNVAGTTAALDAKRQCAILAAREQVSERVPACAVVEGAEGPAGVL